MNNNLLQQDPEIKEVIDAELVRQQNSIELIASENFASKAVMEAQGSVLTNKYAEGYPGKRYYCGCEEIDKVENLAIARLKRLFNCNYANVQVHSGSQANQAVYLSLLKPGDKIMGMSLDCGGHLTHGATPNMSGKWFEAILYGVDPQTYLINYDEIEKLALEHKPKLIIAGYSAYTAALDFKRFREIADKIGAYLMADIAHIAGLVATGLHQNPLPYAHIVTSTTHKTLRGPRGGIIMTNDEEIIKKINRAVFPGLQGGPLMHVIAAKAVAFKEALQPEFKNYMQQVILNAQSLADSLQIRGYEVLTQGTVNHMVLLDLRKHNITGQLASDSLHRAGITSNKNSVPYDNTSPFITSGIRLGSAACTTRGFKEKEFKLIANWIADVLDAIKENRDLTIIEREILQKVYQLTNQFPIY
ncbi:MAG: serine hydroxymethyltransferase [Rickettsiaceae bacterium]|nr:serine hydroxymethyltransferase [Rickettsiaceae bacterium]